MLNSEEKKQYNRHLILEEIGEKGQEALKEAKVLVIGAGGLGCPVLQYLTAAGVGTIGIIDDDLVDQSNLHRQVLYTIEDVEKSKVEVASKRLEKLNPLVFIKTYNERLDVSNAVDLFLEYDIIVDGTDNFPTRYLVNDACVLADKPLVFGSIFKFQGQVTVLNYKNGPTYRCLFPEPPAPNAVPNCSDIGVLGVLPGIVGALQANEVIKMITGIGKVLSGTLLYIDSLSLEQQLLNFQKNEAIEITELEADYNFFCGINPVDFQELTITDFKENKNAYDILDVRTLKEFNAFNIGGHHIPLENLTEKIPSIHLEKPVVVCCQSGLRSKKAIEIITNLRPDLKLYNLKSGLASY